MPTYNVVLKTTNCDGAGTNADVAIELRGQNGGSGWIILDYPHPFDDRERGDQNVYGVPLSFWIGDITEVAFRLRDADGNRPDWRLDYVTIIDFNVPDNQAWEFKYDNWIYIAGKTAWFDGPVLDKRRNLGKAPYAVYAGGGGTSSQGYGTSSHALEAGFEADGSRSLSVVSKSVDQLDIVCADRSGYVHTASWEPSFTDGWHGWWKIGELNIQNRGVTNVVSRNSGKMDVFCIGADGHVYTAAWEPSFTDGWHGWWKVGDLKAIPGTPVTGVSRGKDQLDIFCIGADGHVYTAAWEPSFTDGWHGWWKIGDLKAIPGTPVTGVSRSKDKLDIFCVSTDGHVYTAAWEPSFTDGWHGWWKVGDLKAIPGTPVTGVSRSKDKLDIFCVSTDGHVYTAAWEPSFTDGWHGWWKVGDLKAIPGTPVTGVSRSKEKLDIFCVGAGGYAYTAAWEPSFTDGWHGWWKIRNMRLAPNSSIAPVSRSRDRLDICCVGADGHVYTAAWEPSFTDGWHGWWKIGGLYVT